MKVKNIQANKTLEHIQKAVNFFFVDLGCSSQKMGFWFYLNSKDNYNISSVLVKCIGTSHS